MFVSPSAHVFFHPEMVRAWVETYLPLRDIKPLFIVAKSACATVFLPLVLWRRNWKNVWQRLIVPVGYSDYDYHDPIVTGIEADDISLVDFWNAFFLHLQSNPRERFDCFEIDGVRSAFAGTGKGWSENGCCLFSDLTHFKRPEEFLPYLKSSLRGDLRRQRRRIEEAGGLTTITYGTNQLDDVLRELPAFLEAHTIRWPNSYKAPYFHENLIRRGLPAGLVSFRVVRIGGDVAAWHLGFSFRKHYYSYMPAMVKKFSSLSPGKMMMLYRYEQSIAEGDMIFDHLRGAEEYKEDWSTDSQTLWRFEVQGARPVTSIRNVLVNRIKPMFVRK